MKKFLITTTVLLLVLTFTLSLNKTAQAAGYVKYGQSYNKESYDYWFFEMNLKKKINLNFAEKNLGQVIVSGTKKTYTRDTIVNKFPVGFHPKSVLFTATFTYQYNKYHFNFKSLCEHEFEQKRASHEKGDWEEIRFSIQRDFSLKSLDGYVKAAYKDYSYMKETVRVLDKTWTVDRNLKDQLQFTLNLEKSQQLKIKDYNLGELTIGATGKVHTELENNNLKEADLGQCEVSEYSAYASYSYKGFELKTEAINKLEQVKVSTSYKF